MKRMNAASMLGHGCATFPNPQIGGFKDVDSFALEYGGTVTQGSEGSVPAARNTFVSKILLRPPLTHRNNIGSNELALVLSHEAKTFLKYQRKKTKHPFIFFWCQIFRPNELQCLLNVSSKARSQDSLIRHLVVAPPAPGSNIQRAYPELELTNGRTSVSRKGKMETGSGLRS